MSFSSDVKVEILETRQKKSCCRLSECYGILMFSSSFSGQSIKLKTENEAIALHFRSLVKKCFDILCEILQNGKDTYSVSVPEAQIPNITDILNCSGVDQSVFACKSCSHAFIRGAFLAGGHVSNPDKEYNLDFIIKSEEVSWFLCRMLLELGFDAKTTERSGSYVVYIKESENVEDILTLMGASRAALKVMNAKIIKELRNNINRRNNFDTANISKSSASSARFIGAIQALEQADMLQSLPEELFEIAVARKENYEMSLSELGEKVGLSRAGVFHRLKKIEQAAEQLKQGG